MNVKVGVIFVLLVSQFVFAKSEMLYHLDKMVSQKDICYVHSVGFNINYFKNASQPYWIRYSMTNYILGIKVPIYTNESVNVDFYVSEEIAQELINKIKKTDVFVSKPKKYHQNPLYRLLVEIDGEYMVLAPKKKDVVRDIIIKFVYDHDSNLTNKVKRMVMLGDFENPIDVSLKTLLTMPKKFDNKRIRVSGYYHSEFESFCLGIIPYSQASYLSNSIAIGEPSSFANLENIKIKNDSYIVLEGTFKMGAGGHLGMLNGEIERFTKASTVKHEIKGKEHLK